jgi:hypothetical protein
MSSLNFNQDLNGGGAVSYIGEFILVETFAGSLEKAA